MVGYNKNDTLTSNEKLLAGCISGVVTRFVTQPLDVIKLRAQLQKSREKRSSFWIIRKILKEEGLTAFWHGHSLGQPTSGKQPLQNLGWPAADFLYNCNIMPMVANGPLPNQMAVNTLTSEHSGLCTIFDHGRSFLCGVFAGCTSATLVCPLEVIRVRQMILKQQYSSIIKGAKQIYKSGGILGFYEGLSASVLHVGPSSGISFATFSFFQPLILSYLAQTNEPCTKECTHAKENPHKPEHVVIASSIAASLSGFMSKTMTYPFDLAKRRLQIASHTPDSKYNVPSSSKNLIKCKSLYECFSKTVKNEGLLGLFQGWKVTIYKAQLTSIVAFTTYESVCYMIREIVT